jgi:AcrR family transcriptional regulator
MDATILPAKGERTRRAILEHAARIASRDGLEGLTIGRLAEELELSKSGLFAHFGSKEALQIQTLEAAADHFVQTVVKPALSAPRGEARMRALFERWLFWAKSSERPGGCLFVQAAAELDDRPGRLRDRLVGLQKDWLASLARIVTSGIESGELRPDADPEQFGHDLYAIMLGYHHAARLLADPRAEARAHRAFESLLASVRRRTASAIAETQ